MTKEPRSDNSRVITIGLVFLSLVLMFGGPLLNLMFPFSLTDVPNFSDTTMWELKDVTINCDEGIQWSMSKFYTLRANPEIEGMELAPIWDPGNPIYKTWGHHDPEHQYQSLRGDSDWMPALRSAKSEPIPRIDWSRKVALGFTFLIYPSNDATRPSAYRIFLDPALEMIEDTPSPSLVRF